MATKNIVPRADGEGGIGTAAKNWLKGFFSTIFLGASGLVDSNSNEILKPESVASAVNEITIKNAATGNAPEVKSTGGDTNIDFVIVVKGTGAFQVMDGSGNILATFDKVVSAVNYITLLNSATANTLEVKAVGTDADIDVTLTPKGAGSAKTPNGKIVAEASALTVGQMVKVNADKIIEDGSNTDTEVADAVTKKHSQNTDTGSDSDPFTLTGKFKRSSQVGITAFAGGGQASAVAVTKDIAEISVCATGGDSVKLPVAAAGLQILIINHGAAAADVFPNTDDAINEAAVNTAKSLGINASMLCVTYDDTNWECLTLAR